MKEELYKLFCGILVEGKILVDEPMKNHTSFKIGGPADIMLIPYGEYELIQILKTCDENNIDFYIIGNGTNLLVSDKGIRGVIIKIYEGMNKIEVDGSIITAQAGALLSVTSKVALKNSLGGLEFASGIPGTVGGAVTMNAGAYGGEMKNMIVRVKCLDRQGNILYLTNEEMKFGYRRSIVEEKGLIVLEVQMELLKGNYQEIEEKMKALSEKRTSKQPLHLPSGGSTFKRPEGYFAGKLIEDAGLKGLKHGDAQVSEKHCGFIVNTGNATSEEVRALIKVVQKIVRDKYGVILEPEIKIIGEE